MTHKGLPLRPHFRPPGWGVMRLPEHTEPRTVQQLMPPASGSTDWALDLRAPRGPRPLKKAVGLLGLSYFPVKQVCKEPSSSAVPARQSRGGTHAEGSQVPDAAACRPSGGL